MLVLLLAFASCALPNMPEFTANMPPGGASGTDGAGGIGASGGILASVAYSQTDDTVEIAWFDAGGSVASYRIYYRNRGQSEWTLLGETADGSTLSYEVRRADTGEGSFEFAVSSVAGDGTESEKHTSIDPDAIPPEGWYVIWE